MRSPRSVASTRRWSPIRALTVSGISPTIQQTSWGFPSMLDRNLVLISRDQILEKLAEIDAILDIMALNDENELLAEREHLVWLLQE